MIYHGHPIPHRSLGELFRSRSEAHKYDDLRKGTTFAGKSPMTYEQLDYMLKCAKETRAKKTW